MSLITAFAPSASLDVAYTLDELMPGKIHRPLQVDREAGGKALNAARAAAVVGADVQIVAILGGANGSDIARRLRNSGIRLTVVPSAAETRMCVSIASLGNSQLTEVYEYPSSVSDSEWRESLIALDQALPKQEGWLIVSGGMPHSLPASALAEAVKRAQRAGVLVAVDSHGPALAELLATGAPQVLKVNVAEATEALGLYGATPTELARELNLRTSATVVVTDGTRGSVCTDGLRIHHAMPMLDVGAFPVGSGDSFLGGLVASLALRDPLDKAFRRAVACATANALVPGTARFDRARVEELMSHVNIVTTQCSGGS
ncbi:PfkB family carbohydrate kinase [Salinibacterium sp.]|uniref:1-phosphofructokinase family hexose kinase n=1 Tax=Salinibacterium sp. TaxID=1915057 RepID=UPI00286D3E23|nr:PfkB family carbohydrate kinase [Salinibacterium sp.]